MLYLWTLKKPSITWIGVLFGINCYPKMLVAEWFAC